MNVGGQILWNPLLICETFKISFLMERPHMRDVFGRELTSKRLTGKLRRCDKKCTHMTLSDMVQSCKFFVYGYVCDVFVNFLFVVHVRCA